MEDFVLKKLKKKKYDPDFELRKIGLLPELKMYKVKTKTKRKNNG